MMLRTCIELKNPSPANLRDMPCGNQPCLVGKSPLFTQEIIHQICKFRSFSIVRSDHQRLPTFSCFMLETNGPMAMAGSIRYLKTALPLQNTNLIQLMLENTHGYPWIHFWHWTVILWGVPEDLDSWVVPLIDIKQNAFEALAMRMILQVVSNHQLLMLQLVGGAITSLKNIKVNGKDDIPYMKWKIKVMFQTTNQFNYWIYHHLSSDPTLQLLVMLLVGEINTSIQRIHRLVGVAGDLGLGLLWNVTYHWGELPWIFHQRKGGY